MIVREGRAFLTVPCTLKIPMHFHKPMYPHKPSSTHRVKGAQCMIRRGLFLRVQIAYHPDFLQFE